MTVLENLLLAIPEQSGERLWSPLLTPWVVRREEREHSERAMAVLRSVSLDQLAFEYAGNLSGGQRKLLELARALVAEPAMLLLDEPSAGVNPTLVNTLVDDIRSLQRERGISILLIGHDMDLVARLCDTLIVMTNGSVLIEGDPDTVLNDEAVQEAYLGSQYR